MDRICRSQVHVLLDTWAKNDNDLTSIHTYLALSLPSSSSEIRKLLKEDWRNVRHLQIKTKYLLKNETPVLGIHGFFDWSLFNHTPSVSGEEIRKELERRGVRYE